MVCLDGSEDALKSLHEALKLMDRSRDFIEVIHVKKFSVKPETVEKQAQDVFHKSGFSAYSFTAIDFNVSEAREDTILNYVHGGSNYVDFFVVSNHGTGIVKHEGKYLG